jgi:hypothetical protein
MLVMPSGIFLRDDDDIEKLASNLRGGDHWAVESEIFWKARGDHLKFTVN